MFVADLRPIDPPRLLPAGKQQGLQVRADLVSVETAIGFIHDGDSDARAAAAVAMAQTLTATLPLGATMESAVLVLEEGPDRRLTHYGLSATMWALVEPGGRLVQAHRPEWPADSGLTPFSTMNESLAVLLPTAAG